MKRKKTKISKGGLYIALCGCAIVMALFGYVGNKANNIEEIEIEDIKTKDIAYSISDEEMFDVDYKVDNKKETLNQEEKVTVEETKITASDENTSVEVSNKEEVEEFILSMPVEGNVIFEFSDGKLLYNEKLSDWRAHNGIDISCDENSAICVSYDGVVKKIYDNEMGKNIVVDHKNGYETVYSNLSDEIAVKEGQEIKTGDVIAKAGSSAYGDFSDSVYLHFELISNGENINPIDFIK